MNWEYIVIHHSFTKDSKTVSWPAIRGYHKDTLGWSDIGYHFGVEIIDDAVEVLVGRPCTLAGAHAKEMGMNKRGLGICVVGNFDKEAPSGAVWRASQRLTRALMDTFTIPKEKVIGHREVGLMAGFDWQRSEYKTCPGRLFDMESYRATL